MGLLCRLKIGDTVYVASSVNDHDGKRGTVVSAMSGTNNVGQNLWKVEIEGGPTLVFEENILKKAENRPCLTRIPTDPRAEELHPRAEELQPRARELQPRARELLPRAQELHHKAHLAEEHCKLRLGVGDIVKIQSLTGEQHKYNGCTGEIVFKWSQGADGTRMWSVKITRSKVLAMV